MEDLKNNYEFNRALHAEEYCGEGTFGTSSFSFEEVEKVNSNADDSYAEDVEYYIINKVYVNNDFLGYIKTTYYEDSYGETKQQGLHEWVEGKKKMVTVWE